MGVEDGAGTKDRLGAAVAGYEQLSYAHSRGREKRKKRGEDLGSRWEALNGRGHPRGSKI